VEKVTEEILEGISGRKKAALLLGVLRGDVAKNVIQHLTKEEREDLTSEIMRLGDYSHKIVEAVLRDYIDFMEGGGFDVLKRGARYAFQLLEGSLPSDEIEEMMGRIRSNTIRPFDTLKRIRDVSPILTYLHSEDPQTIAVIISYMKPSQAAEVLESLPDEKQVEVALGIANIDQTNKEVLLKVEEHLNNKLQNLITDEQNQTDGVKTLVNILNNVKRSTEKYLFEQFDDIDAELSRTVKDNMFVFEDILKLDERDLQQVVNKITDNELVARALKIASEELKEKFYAAMSEGRRALIADADEGMGRVKLAEAEEAQQKIANLVKELDKQGKIYIQRGDEDVIV
jgi:flagellar motor switch protein FliG